MKLEDRFNLKDIMKVGLVREFKVGFDTCILNQAYISAHVWHLRKFGLVGGFSLGFFATPLSCLNSSVCSHVQHLMKPGAQQELKERGFDHFLFVSSPVSVLCVFPELLQ